MDDLVERARTYYGKLSQRPLPSWVRATFTACVNRIDAQEAEIRSLRAQVERLTEREAQAKLDGVRAGIEASARDDIDWYRLLKEIRHTHGGTLAEMARAIVAATQALDAEAIAKGEG
jgi:hypothetical protein